MEPSNRYPLQDMLEERITMVDILCSRLSESMIQLESEIERKVHTVNDLCYRLSERVLVLENVIKANSAKTECSENKFINSQRSCKTELCNYF